MFSLVLEKLQISHKSIFLVNSNTNEDAMEEEAEEIPKPFAKIDLVSEGSPAHDAGMKVGDLILEFGTQNATNFKSLNDIAQLVKNSENRNVRVKILRHGKIATLTLVPKRWSGQGLLGCKIIPL